MSAAAPALSATERARDAGLDRGIGTFGLTLAVVNGVVGAGIFALPRSLAADIGARAPLAYLVTAAAMAAVVMCFAGAGSRVPTSGGAYGWVEAAFGPVWGFVTGMLTWLASVLAAGGIAAALADGLGSVIPVLHDPGVRALVIAALFMLLAAINIAGVRQGTRFVIAATLVKLVPLGLFLLVGGVAVLGGGVMPPAAATEAPTGAYGQAIILAVFAFCGMETTVATSGEVAAPARTVPRALIAAMLFILALYVSLQLVAQGLLGGALATSAEPLADGIARVDPRLGAVVLAGAAISRFGWLAGDVLGAPRVLFAFGRDALMWRQLGRLHARTAAPWVAILVHAAIAAALAATNSFEGLAIVSTLATMGLYILACAAAWRLQARGIATLGPPLAFRLLPAAAVTGIASMTAICAMAKWSEIAALVGTIAASAAWAALVVGRRNI